MSKKSIFYSSFIALLFLSGSEFSTAQIAMTNPSVIKETSTFDIFTPRPQSKTRIDYDILDSLLEEMVLNTGPSSRKRMPRPQPITGSRFVRGHASAYRLEGNRIPYSEIKPEFINLITEYRQDLEQIGSKVDIASLSKNEQLAFWINLHNIVIIEQLAKEYPVRQPSLLKIGLPRTLLDEAKIINVANRVLSLKDIREKIVYPNWRNPKVIYGFYLGDIGSPSIQNSAYTADNLSDLLDRNANEFVNSLRGFHVRNNKQYVSQLYKDVAPFYFQSFDRDISTHIKSFMRDDVKSQMTAVSFHIDRYDHIIADLTAGQGIYKSISPLSSGSRSGQQITGQSNLTQYIDEIVVKRRTLKRQGLIGNGVVIIEDIETHSSTDGPAPDIDLDVEP